MVLMYIYFLYSESECIIWHLVAPIVLRAITHHDVVIEEIAESGYIDPLYRCTLHDLKHTSIIVPIT